MKNIKLIVSIMLISVMLMIPVISNAGLYATKDGTPMYTEKLDNAFLMVRRMESQYGTLGKYAVFADDFTDTTGNGIDCHLSKNTEWGTAAMLAASEFGFIPQQDTIDSTTGNNTGIFGFITGGAEMTAGFTFGTADKLPSTTYFPNYNVVNSNYYNYYEDSNRFFPGDGVDIRNWYYSSSNLGSTQHFIRGGQTAYTFGLFYVATTNALASCRAVVVCGEGL